jgi:L-asparaginase II
MNCSGKQAATLAAAKLKGWSTETNMDPNHPLQLIIKDSIEEISGVEVESVAVDGCGVPLFSTTVTGVAQSFRKLGLAKAGTAEHHVAQEMRPHPFLIAGKNQPNTLTIEDSNGSLSKGGADGEVLGISTAEGASVGVRVIDGGLTITTVIAIPALEKIGALPKGSLLEHPKLGVTIIRRWNVGWGH